MSYHAPILPTPAAQTRADGWSPARQRRFVETLAATGVILIACEAVRISPRAAYALRNRGDGAAFRLGWDAAILLARARLADDLLARAILGQEEVISRDEDSGELIRRRHDNRLAMSMLARLDRMADAPAEGTDAAVARVVAQDFDAYLDLLCPRDRAEAEADALDLPRPGAEPSAGTLGDGRVADGTVPDLPPLIEGALEEATPMVSPGAAAALFVAARTALNGAVRRAEKAAVEAAMYEGVFKPQERCELPPMWVDPMTLPPEEAAARLRGLWWDDHGGGWRTDYPAPPGFTGDQSDPAYEIDAYTRALTPAEEAVRAAREEAAHRPYEDAAIRARDAYFGFTPN